MTDKNTGGAAFPCDRSEFFERNEGMTLRDYFAAKALQGLLAGGELRAASGASTFNGYSPMKAVSDKAYQLADAMLEARQS